MNVIRNPALGSEAAQLWAFAFFKADFQRRFPGGEVLSELEYIGDSVYFVRGDRGPTYRGIKGKPKLTEIFRAMSEDYRNGWKDGDFRKSDGLGLDAQGLTGELLEVTTWRNRESAIRQMGQKLRILSSMNIIHGLPTVWNGTPWKPTSSQRYQILKDTPEYVDYICFEPTFRKLPGAQILPAGVVLYEIHRQPKPKLKKVPVPVPLPEKVKDAIAEGAQLQKKTGMDPVRWAEGFMAEHPYAGAALRAVCLVAGAAVAVVAVAAIFDPVPGDEVAAFSLAMALVKVATR